jgi:glutamate racemase
MGSIGIFDSGIGGLSVLVEIRRLAPSHPVVYLADQAWAPYGERTLQAVRQRAVAIAELLISRGCDLIVVACNSASAAALHHLRDRFEGIPFVGMEPAVKPAATRSERGVIGVLATEATFQGELYASVVDRHANGAQVVAQACPGLAAAVETRGVDDPVTRELLERYLQPLLAAGVDTVVLGCTHYPFLLDEIRQLLGDDVAVIDPAPAVARQTMRLLGTPAAGGATTFLTTGDPERFDRQLARILDTGDPGSMAVVLPEPQEARLGTTRLVALTGDLTTQPVAAVVNAANASLQHGGGVAAAIVRAGGPVIQRDSNRWVQRHGTIVPGEAAVTTAGSLPAANVIHVVGPVYREGQDNAGLLRRAVVAALDAAVAIGARSVAFPAISAGIFGYPLGEATAVIAAAVVEWVRDHPGTLDEVRLVGYQDQVTRGFASGLAASHGSGEGAGEQGH